MYSGSVLLPKKHQGEGNRQTITDHLEFMLFLTHKHNSHTNIITGILGLNLSNLSDFREKSSSSSFSPKSLTVSLRMCWSDISHLLFIT